MPFELLPALIFTAILAGSGGGFVRFMRACGR